MVLKRYILYIVLVVAFLPQMGLSQITINIGSGSGPQGSEVCVDVTVENFVRVTSTQFVIRWDPKVLDLMCPPDLETSCLNADGMTSVFPSNFNCSEVADGFANFIWFDLNVIGKTLDASCNNLFTLCFTLVGEPCDESDICITESGSIPFEFVQLDENGEDIDLPPTINKGNITIDPDGYAITTAFCSTDDNSNSGSITFSGAGGTPPYDWVVEPGGIMGSGLEDCEKATVDNLGPGNYTITYTDANNVVRTETVTIATNSEFPFLVNLQGNDPTCFDLFNGSIDVVDIEGGEAPFAYEWSTFQFEEDRLTQLSTGDYALTITDVNGCTTSAEVSLDVDTINLNVQVISGPSCEPGAQDGIVSIFAEGGNPFPGGNYMFEVDGIDVPYFSNSIAPTNPFTPANLPAGCFEVVAFDNASIPCFSDPIIFCLEAGSFSDLTIDVTDVSCFGECDGEVEIIGTNTGDFNFTITGPNGVSVSAMNTTSIMEVSLCAGDYDVSIEDINANCVKDTFFTISEPDLLELIVIDSVGPGCGGGDGMITLEAMGGTEDYTYEWNDAFDQPVRVNMGGGNYSVTVTDANGCEASISFSFADGGDIGLNGFVCNAVSCGGAMDASICAEVAAQGSFTFSWEDESGMSLGTGEQIDGVGGGIYYVTATDGMCTDVDTVIVAPGETPSVNIVQNDPTCPDSNDGTLTATLSTGTNPAMFEWTEPPSTAILSSGAVLLDGVGTYNLHITDANGCEADTLVTMNPPLDQIQVDISNIVANPCFGSCEGSATFTASGGPSGTGNYVFFISGIAQPVDPGGNQAIVDVICGGANWVYAIDGICASDTFFFDVPDAEPISLDADASAIDPPSCAGGDDGNISIVVQGGDDSSYDILWVNEGVMGPDLSGLVAGEYIYNVTDGSNCLFVDTIVLEEPDPLEVSVNPLVTVDLGCSSDNSGIIGLNVFGGNSGQLTYDWDPAVSNQDIAVNLGPGLYSVTVTDSKGCSAETSYELTSADPIVAIINAPEEPDCFGGQTCIGVDSVSGGVGSGYTFTILNGINFPIDTCINVFAGEYLIKVFDGSGCSIDTTIIIGQPEEIIVDAGPDITINLGEESNPVSVSIVSELDVDSILWNPVTDLDCNTMDCQVVTFSPFSTTDYTVTVIDEAGCVAFDEITVFVDLSRNVYFANIFSPNGDNQNDFFQLATGPGVSEISVFRLFDRWGNMIYEELDYMPDDSLHPGWDGSYNNRDMDPGVYVYFAEVLFDDGVRVAYKGDVTLIR